MAQNPPAGCQRVIPYLITKDPGAVMDFAVKAFGFTEAERMAGPGGVVMHGELAMHENLVMLGPGRPEYPAQKSMVYVYVDDVDAHHAHAVAAGATIVSELTDQFYGDRAYGAEDPDGNQWHFATHVKEMTREELEAAAAAAMGGGE